MAFVVFALGILTAALGAVVVVAPEVLVSIIQFIETPAGLYVAAASRVLFGLALFFAAPTSRAPRTLRVLGVVFISAGLLLPFFGIERLRSYIDWWLALGPGFFRGWAVVALAFGAALAYAVFPGCVRRAEAAS